MNGLPTLFISHGAPDLPIRDGAVTHFLKSLHQQFPKPKAILVISAHWDTAEPTVSKAVRPQTIYDFGQLMFDNWYEKKFSSKNPVRSLTLATEEDTLITHGKSSN